MRTNAFGELIQSRPPFIRSFDGDGGGAGSGFTPITTQAEFDSAIAVRINREKARYSQFDGVDLAALQSQAAELVTLRASQGASESELQAKITAAEARATTAETALATANSTATDATSKLGRYEIAAKVGIPLTHAPRLIGSTPEELEADATEFKKTLRTGAFDPGQGQNDGGAAEGANGIAEAEKRFGKPNQ